MAKEAKKLTPEETRKHEEYRACFGKLESIGMAKETLEKLNQAEVINMAKALIQTEENLAIDKQQENAKKLESAFKKNSRSDFENLASTLIEVFKSEIGDSPTKSFSESIETNKGNVIVGITAYQDVDKPDVRKKKEAKQKVQSALKDMAEKSGLQNLVKMLTVKKGTKDRFTFGVYGEKFKQDDLEFQLTLGYEVKKDED